MDVNGLNLTQHIHCINKVEINNSSESVSSALEHKEPTEEKKECVKASEALANYVIPKKSISFGNNIIRFPQKYPEKAYDYRSIESNAILPKNETVFVNRNAILNLAGQYNIDLTDNFFENMPEASAVYVGRSGGVKIPDYCDGISRVHLDIQKAKDGFFVTDLSTNGTQIADPGNIEINLQDKVPIFPEKAYDYRNVENNTKLPYKQTVFVNSNAILNLAGQYGIDLSDKAFNDLKEAELIYVGREGDVKIPTVCDNVSRIHLSVQKANDGFYITDLSTNGTEIASTGSAGYGINPDIENDDAHYEYSISHPILKNMHIENGWSHSLTQDKRHCPWKMHIYADNENDWRMLVDTVGLYLQNNDINWKTLSPDYSIQDLNLSENQKGKAFTIYPRSEGEFKVIAADINNIIKKNSLQFSGSKISGDRQLGDSGRIFYRYEFKSKENANEILDLTVPDNCERYLDLYDKNRGADRYLAGDMTPNDDPFYNFDPDSTSMYNVS